MDPATISMLISAGVDVGKMLFDMFKKKPPSPGEQARPWLEKAEGLYKPYQQQGQEAYGKLNPLFSQMAQDPASYLESMMKGYEPSRGYQLQRDEALKAASASAAAGGMRGTPQDLMNQTRLTDQLMGQDMQQWLNNVMNLQGRGLGGLGEFYKTGFEATGDIGNIYGSQANLGMLGEMFKQMQSQGSQEDFWKSLSGLGGTLGGFDWNKLGGSKQSNPFISSSPRSGLYL